jgi:hypothetical protein
LQTVERQNVLRTASANRQHLVINNLPITSNKNNIIFDAFLLRWLLLILEEFFWARKKI